jgi:F1F0 ATPase subunit 2
MGSGTVSRAFAQILLDAAPFTLLGALLGAAYFAALRQNVERYVAGRPLGPTVALHVGRLLLAGLAFALIAGAGAAALLAALAGFLLVRTLLVRRVRTGT